MKTQIPIRNVVKCEKDKIDDVVTSFIAYAYKYASQSMCTGAGTGMMNQQMQWCETYLVITSLFFHTAIETAADNIDAVVAICAVMMMMPFQLQIRPRDFFNTEKSVSHSHGHSIQHRGLDMARRVLLLQ